MEKKTKKKRKYYQGIYVPVNPGKWRGNIHDIVFRSGWEKKMCKKFDLHENILEVASETIILNGDIIPFIPYMHPIKNKMARYFPDFWIRYINNKEEIIQAIIEVKPYGQTIPPIQSKTKTGKITEKRKIAYQKALMTYAINKAKWHAANEFAKNNGMKFVIITEKDTRSYLL